MGSNLGSQESGEGMPHQIEFSYRITSVQIELGYPTDVQLTKVTSRYYRIPRIIRIKDIQIISPYLSTLSIIQIFTQNINDVSLQSISIFYSRLIQTFEE